MRTARVEPRGLLPLVVPLAVTRGSLLVGMVGVAVLVNPSRDTLGVTAAQVRQHFLGLEQVKVGLSKIRSFEVILTNFTKLRKASWGLQPNQKTKYFNMTGCFN